MTLAHKALIPIMFFHWLGWDISAVYMSGFAILLLINQIFNIKQRILSIGIWSLIVVLIFLAINLSSLIAFKSQFTILLYWYYYCSLFILTFFIAISGRWEFNELYIAARIIFWIAFYSIAVEFIIVNLFDISNTVMPAARLSPAYIGDINGLYRPFGLTGQPSVNGGVLMLAYLLLAQIEKTNIKNTFALLIGSLLTISGQAILSTFLTLNLIRIAKIKNLYIRVGFLLLLISIILLVLWLDLFQKISLDYLVYVLWEQSYALETFQLLDISGILLGTLGEGIPGNVRSEVWVINTIQIYGVLFFLILWAFVWALLRKTRQPYIYFLCCFLVSLHYPTIFFIEAQLPLILIYISCLKFRN